jgi:predicted RNA-binding Zn-ribbon protein involved in translation (DUF1610 family)
MTRVSVVANTGQFLQLYVFDCPNCGVIFGVDQTYDQRRRNDKQTFHCPNGHSMSYSGPTKAEKDAKEAKARADRLAASLTAEQDQRRAAEREAAKSKASEVRIRWRIGNGVCPCCNRTFTALAAHVATKHPEFAHHDLVTLSVRMRELLATIRRETEDRDVAVVDAYEIGANMNTVRALVNRGLVETIDYHLVALTGAGWPLSEKAIAVESQT